MFEILLYSYFGLDHTNKFEIIHMGIDHRQCDIIFMYDHRQYNAQCALIFCLSFKLSKSCLLLKVRHAYQSFLEHNLKAVSYQSMEQLEMLCVKLGEGFCYFDCNISHFGEIKLWYSRQAFCSCSISYGTSVEGFTTKKNIWSHLTVSRVGGWVELKTFWHFV